MLVAAFDQLAEHRRHHLVGPDLALPDPGVDLDPVRLATHEQLGAEPGAVGQHDHRSDLPADVEQ